MFILVSNLFVTKKVVRIQYWDHFKLKISAAASEEALSTAKTKEKMVAKEDNNANKEYELEILIKFPKNPNTIPNTVTVATVIYVFSLILSTEKMGNTA
jgi:hypothetical protein